MSDLCVVRARDRQPRKAIREAGYILIWMTMPIWLPVWAVAELGIVAFTKLRLWSKP